MNLTRYCLVALVALGAFGVSSCREQAGPPRLKDAFEHHFLMGAALNDDIVSGRDSAAAGLVIEHFNSITAENAMKWEHIHPAADTFDFGPADRLVAFGEKNGMAVMGHTLVWHDQTPREAFLGGDGKLLGRDAMLVRMKDHIETVVGRYKGKVKGWDVVNEALTDEGALRPSPWMQTVGEDFVAKAFEFAHQADPEAELYYNDFSLDKPAKRDAAVRLVKDLKARGFRVDAIGIQGHWGMDYPTDENLKAFIEGARAIGVKVLVTEMDVDILPPAFDYQGADISMRAELRDSLNPYPNGLPDSMQTVLADRYAHLFRILVSYADVVDRVTIWGVHDTRSWLNYWPVPGRTSYPLLFDRSYRPKKAFYAVLATAKTSK